MKELTRFVLLASFALLGCHKKEAAQNPAPAPADAAAAETPAPAAPQAQAAPAAAPPAPAKQPPPPPAFIKANADNNVRQAVVGEVDGNLTAALRSFVRKKGRMPGSFVEFVGASLDGTPRAPEGKRFVIDSSDMTVKAVPR